MLNLDDIEPSAVFQDIKAKPTEGINCCEYYQIGTWQIQYVDYMLTLPVVLAESSSCLPYILHTNGR